MPDQNVPGPREQPASRHPEALQPRPGTDRAAPQRPRDAEPSGWAAPAGRSAAGTAGAAAAATAAPPRSPIIKRAGTFTDAEPAPPWNGARPDDIRGQRLITLNPGHHVSTPDGDVWTSQPLDDPTPAPAPAPAAPQPAPALHDPAPAGNSLIRSVASLEPLTDDEANAFAGRFATDYLSWDEDHPTRRPAVLRTYLADHRNSTLGWSGTGRQRADSPLCGRRDRRSQTTVIVEVNVRITPYTRTGAHSPDPDGPVYTDPPPDAVGPSSAPPPTAPGWTGGQAHWMRMAIPVTRDTTGRLVVDPTLIPAPTS